jgi:two-component system, chemotaxis family, protein-glutamate methylesterase/glutaminase
VVPDRRLIERSLPRGLPVPRHDLVVIGASAGGVEALSRLVAGLPADLAAALLVVLHTPPASESHLPAILARAGPLPAAHARDGEHIRPGQIYVAPPNYHLTVQAGSLRLVQGPTENGFRPAADPLFRTAAQAYGEQVVGVVLSGALDDGAGGLTAIKQQGGVTVAQDPDEALVASMPRSAIRFDHVDHVLPIAEIAALLMRLAGSPAPERDLEL